jgi:hypothetical protein
MSGTAMYGIATSPKVCFTMIPINPTAGTYPKHRLKAMSCRRRSVAHATM